MRESGEDIDGLFESKRNSETPVNLIHPFRREVSPFVHEPGALIDGSYLSAIDVSVAPEATLSITHEDHNWKRSSNLFGGGNRSNNRDRTESIPNIILDHNCRPALLDFATDSRFKTYLVNVPS
jgi:hypothetical protein